MMLSIFENYLWGLKMAPLSANSYILSRLLSSMSICRDGIAI
jgi:hypothetical protein